MSSVGIMASSVVTAACTSVLREPFNDLTAWGVSGSPAPSIVAGRTGTAVSISTSSAFAQYEIPAGSQSDTMTIGLAFKTDGVATQPQVCQLTGGGAAQTTLRVTSAGALQYRRSTTTLATSATGLIVANTWYYVEVQSKLHDTTGFIIVRRNGVEVINTTALDTNNTGAATYGALRIAHGVSPTVALWDDLYLTTGAGCPFQGDQVIT